jgi:hypothetical protein
MSCRPHPVQGVAVSVSGLDWDWLDILPELADLAPAFLGLLFPGMVSDHTCCGRTIATCLSPG